MALSLKNTFLSFDVREGVCCSFTASRRARSLDATELRSNSMSAITEHLETLNQLIENKEPSACITSGFRKVSSCSSVSTMASEGPQSLQNGMSITSMSPLPSWADCFDSDGEDVKFELVTEATPKVSTNCSKMAGRTPVRRSGGPAGTVCHAPSRGSLSFPAAVGKPVRPSGAPVCRPAMTTVAEEQAPHVSKCDVPLAAPSLGSVGHEAGRCAGACKYFSKARGCKDATQCSHCHLCTWNCKLHSKQRRARAKGCHQEVTQ